jgi:diguanylate cyclase (GGDEF)-like protein
MQNKRFLKSRKSQKILLIDKGNSSVHGFQDTLKKKGFTLLKAQSLKKATHLLKNDNIALITVDKDFSSDKDNFKNFKKISNTIPKIIINSDGSFKGMSCWLKDKLTIPVKEPFSSKEFLARIKKLIKDKEILDENTQLQAALKANKRELNFFKDITKILTSTMDLDKTLSAIMKKIKEMIGAKECFMLFIDQEKNEFFLGKIRGKRPKEIQRCRFSINKDIAGRAVKKGLPIIIPDMSKRTRYKNKNIDRLLKIRTKTMMCFPIKIKDSTIGILEIVNRASGEPFTKTDLELVKQAAIAIERAFLYQKMEELTITDDLTNLFNLRYLNRSIETEIERAKRYNVPLTLIFMDIDSFKNVNDRYGHLVGSKVLVEIAKLLLSNLRSVDIVARYGGDEFVIVLPQTSLEGGFLVAERLRNAMEQHVFLKNEGYSIRMTGSFGVASYPQNAKSKEELFRIADEAMYRGKATSKNIVYAAAK